MKQFGPWRHAHGEAGEVATARVGNPLENPLSRGKVRPVVLVRREGGHWYVMGLTTKRTFLNGMARTPVPNPGGVGLNGPGYLWGDRLTRISVLDLDRHLGWAAPALAATVVSQAGLQAADAAALLQVYEPAAA